VLLLPFAALTPALAKYRDHGYGRMFCPAYIVRFVARVSTPMESFDVPMCVARTRVHFKAASGGVSVRAGSVFVTTELKADDESTANGLVAEVNALDDDALKALFDAPTVQMSVISEARGLLAAVAGYLHVPTGGYLLQTAFFQASVQVEP